MPAHISSRSTITVMFTQCIQRLCTSPTISLNKRTGKVSVNKWENKVTSVGFLKINSDILL